MASSVDSRADVEAATKPLFNYLIKLPKIDWDILEEPFTLAALELDEERKARNAIKLQVEEKIASSKIHDLNNEYVKAKDLSARELVKSKLAEIDRLQSVIDKAKSVLSIDRIKTQIRQIEEYIVEQKPLPSEELQKLAREMNLLDRRRMILSHSIDQLSDCADTKDGIRRVLELKEMAEESLKIVMKELDILKDSAFKAEAAVLESNKKYDDEMKQIEQLQAMSAAAEDALQAAQAKFDSMYEKNRKRVALLSDCKEAATYYTCWNRENFPRFCKSYVENFMKLWNEDEEFRRLYVRIKEKDKMVSDEVDVAASEMDEIKQETSVGNTNSETEKINAKAKKKARRREKRRADKLIGNEIKVKDRSSEKPQKSWLPILGYIKKKQLQQVMWAGITSVFVCLFIFSNFIIKWQKPFY